MVRILVTGGAGFVGSHTCLRLLEAGNEIISMDSYINSSKYVYKAINKICKLKGINQDLIKIFDCDVRDEISVGNIFQKLSGHNKEIHAVIHFAGLKSVKESRNDPNKYWEVNVGGTLNLLKVMKKFDCRKIVFSSSATIYGYPEKLPIVEDSQIKPINPYGKTKAAVEQLLFDIYNSDPNRWSIINLRYFNPVGSHYSGLIGENPKGIPNNLFPYICQVASGKMENLKIYGSDWPTKDGTCIRDYIHIEDLAEGHKKALELVIKEKKGIYRCINLGCGYGTSVLEMIKTFEKANNCKIKKVFETRREGDVAKTFADISLAKKILGWAPKKSLYDACKDGWRWAEINPDGY
tara:strand:+ start:28799 stop:29851 length:1053 start_codon:yes stop_codon:yes gene_type:complete